MERLKLSSTNNSTLNDILNRNFLSLMDRLKSMKMNYNKSKKGNVCKDEFDFFIVWLDNFISANREDYLKIINDLSGEVIINKRSEKFLNEEDVLFQNVLKLDDVIWNHFKFTEDFITTFKVIKNKDQVIKVCLCILIGLFEDLKIVEIYHNKKLCIVFSQFLSKDFSLYFSIYFENLLLGEVDFSDCYEVINFIGLFKSESEFRKVFNTFYEEFENDDIKYPILEFDKTGIKVTNNYDIFILQKKPIIHNKKEIFLNYPHLPFKPKHVTKSKKLQLFLGEFEIQKYFDFKEFILGKRNKQVFEDIQNFYKNKHPYVLDFLNREEFDLKLSEQEKCLIREKENIIISGRSGTGKTTIIIFKILISFLNFYVFKSEADFKEITWSNIFIPTEFDQEKLKFVFTSYSHSLCFKVEELYSHLFNALCEKLKINHYYAITNFDFIKKLNSFRQVENYPLFINFRKILFLIDGTLNNQFFQRKIGNRINKTEEECDIRFYYNCEYRLNNYNIPNLLNFDIKTYFLRTPLLKDDNYIIKKEIDEKDFTEIFFNKILNKNLIKLSKNLNLSSSLIFSQINSVIKGSIFSHLCHMNCISKNDYFTAGNKMTELSIDQREIVYEIFIEYENWKLNNNLFDLQDFVNHLIRQVKIELQFKNEIKLIDYLYVDEVQDLTINQIYLLTLITRYPLVYAGDTCQTVSKSIRFRFQDLFQIFHNFTEIIDNYQKPLHAPLNNNFRFGPNILKLSNFISNLIYEIFPNSIDKFSSEFTLNKKYFLPCTLNSIESLITLVSCKKNIEFNYFTFAASHMLICRTTEIAKNMKIKYEKLLIMDVTESKGLEYEIVIIFNFFKDSNCKRIWTEILNSIEIIEKDNENVENMTKTMKSEKMLKDHQDEILKIFEKILTPKLTKKIDNILYYEFCTELKQLYVAITRARTFLIFYDEDKENFPIFLKMLDKINLINIQEEKSEHKLLENISNYFTTNNFNINKEDFEKEGDKYFEMKRYNIAEYYYNMVNEIKAKQARAYQKFEDICEQERNREHNYFKLNEEVISILKEINLTNNNIYGDCLVNLEKYQEALIHFERINNLMKCANICMQKMKDYYKAFIYYNKINEISLAIEALINGKLFEKLFTYIHDKKDVLDINYIFDLYRKYAHYYLIPFFYKTKEIKFKIKSNFYKQENKKNPKPFIFLLFEKYEPIIIDKIYKKFEPVYKFENKNQSKKINFKTLDEFLIKKFTSNMTIKLGQIDNSIFRIKKNNTFIYTNSDQILSPEEKNNEFNLFKDVNKKRENKDKFLKLFKFIHQYISIIYEKTKLSQINNLNMISNINEFEQFLNPVFFRIILDNVENLKLYPKYCETILNSISGFENCETLKILYSIFITSNLSVIYKEIYEKTKINFWKHNEVDSPEKIFQFNKYLIKEKDCNIQNFIEQNKENLKILYQEKLLQIMRIIKQLNINEEDSIVLLKKLLFMNGYFESLITIVEFPINIYLASVTSNYKSFHRLISTYNKIINENLIMKTLQLYVFSNDIRLNLCKMLTYLNKWRIIDPKMKEKQTSIRLKMNVCIRNLYNYPKLYEIIENILHQFGIFASQSKELNKTPPIIFYLKKFRSFLENPKNFNLKEALDLIEIGSTISIFFYFYGGDNFEFKDIFEYENKEGQTILTFELMQELKCFMVALNSYSIKHFDFSKEINNIDYSKKIIFFTIFNTFNITTFPQEKIFHKIYGNLPILIINSNSIIFTEVNTFKNVAIKILKSKKTKNFDAKGDNFIMKFKYAYDAFYKLISNFSNRLINFSLQYLIYPVEPYFPKSNNMNQFLQFYSIFFNNYFIQGLDKYNSNDFVKCFHSYFNYILKNKLGKALFLPESFNNLFYYHQHSSELFTKILNIEFLINMSYLPVINNNNLNHRSVEFMDSFFKILSQSLFNNYNRELENYEKNIFSKNLINFYFMSFLFCGSKRHLFVFNFTKIKNQPDNLISPLLDLNKYLINGNILNFCMESISFIFKNQQNFSGLILLSWIKKLSLFIYISIQLYIQPNYNNIVLEIYSNDFIKGDFEFIQIVKSQLVKEMEDKNNLNLENNLEIAIRNYFMILNNFMNKFMTNKNYDKGMDEEQNDEKNYEEIHEEIYLHKILLQFFNLEIYKIYKTLKNQIKNINSIETEEKFLFVNDRIIKFCNYYDGIYYLHVKENFEMDMLNPESIEFIFEYYDSSNKKYFNNGYISKMRIDLENKKDEKVKIIYPHDNINDKQISNFLNKTHFVFKLKPILKNDEVKNSLLFLYSDNLALDEYISIVDKIYEP